MLARVIYGARVSMMVAVCAVLFGLVHRRHARPARPATSAARSATSWSACSTSCWPFPRSCSRWPWWRCCKGDPIDGQRAYRRSSILILALGIVSIPILARITRANTLAWAQREFVTGGARPRGQELPHHLPGDPAERPAGDDLDLAARHRRRHRRRGRPRHPRGRASNHPPPPGARSSPTGRTSLRDAPFIVFIPCIAIFLTVLSLNYLGDVDPRPLRRPGECPVTQRRERIQPTRRAPMTATMPAGDVHGTGRSGGRRGPAARGHRPQDELHLRPGPGPGRPRRDVHARAGQDPRRSSASPARASRCCPARSWA